MIKEIIPLISDILSDKIISSKPITGGDISSAFHLETSKGNYFLKVNNDPFALKMFLAEQKGLSDIAATNTIAVPSVYVAESYEDMAIILMDFIDSKRPHPADYARFGTELAKMHLVTNSEFGYSSNNFIGSLDQSNNENNDWADFYWSQRIKPQFQLALNNNLLSADEIPSKEQSISLFKQIFNNVKPSLLHGDLWGGNYLISTDGTPYLIDPAVYYGHSMVDIAMSQLFGSFGPDFYNSYHQIIPKSDFYKEEIDLYQLYYLLVHLNLFGRGYYTSVSDVMKRCFK